MTRRLIDSLTRSLRVKVTLGGVLPLVVILGAFTAIDYRRHRAAVLEELSLLASYSGQVIENNLRHELMESDFTGVQDLLDLIADEEFMLVYLLDHSGRVVFAPNDERRGDRLDNRNPDCTPCHRLPPAERPRSVVVTTEDGRRVFRSMLPIENSPACSRCHDEDRRVLGLVLTDIPTEQLESSVASAVREKLFWWAGTILVTVLVVNLAMSRLVIRRLERVARSLTRFGRGELDLRLKPDSPDDIGRLAGAFNEMGRNIQAAEAKSNALSEDVRRHAARQRNLLKKLITAQEEERRRVAHDLHDDLGQDLAGLAVGLEGVEQLWADPPEQVRQRLRETRARVAEMTDRAYDMILSLRPSALDDLGLVPALRIHAERTLGKAGTQFEIDSRTLAVRLPPETETALFRTLQEALGNVVRHGRASRVRVTLASRNGVFEGEVVDDGCGFDPATVPTDGSGPRGLGLLGMQERVALCGGTLEISSAPGAGTRIRIRVPLEKVN
jgi:signal transduction histidine kinase